MPSVPPDQVPTFPDRRRPARHHDQEPQQSKHEMVGRPRGPPPTQPMQPRVLRTPDAARYLGLTASTLEKMRLVGGGPRFVRLGTRAVGYAIADLDAFIEVGRRTSTSDPAAPTTPRGHNP
jgi:predicted DNA-binding transcriptional regulator AlpA